MRVPIFSSLFLLFSVCLFAGGSRTAGSAPVASTVAILSPGPEGAEGNFGTTGFIFTLVRTGDLIGQCRVTYETRDGSAFAPEDFAPAGGVATFAPGQTVVQVPVAVAGETFLEQDETFFFALISAAGDCTIAGSPVISTINSDEGTVPPGTCFTGRFIEGDVGSGTDAALRVNDLVQLRRLVLGTSGLPPGPLPACYFQIADINGNCGDGRIDSADVTVMRQWILQGAVQRPNCGPDVAN